MSKEEKNSGVSIFGQSEFLMDSDPIEEMFALNLGDFISESLISEDLAKKISIKSNKKERLVNQLKELIDIYSSNNTLCVLDFNRNEEQAIYTSIAKSIVKMVEVIKCIVFLIKDKELKIVGSSDKDTKAITCTIEDLTHNEVIENNNCICVPIQFSHNTLLIFYNCI